MSVLIWIQTIGHYIANFEKKSVDDKAWKITQHAELLRAKDLIFLVIILYFSASLL